MKFINQEAERISGEKLGFSFGQNWQKYLENVSEDRINAACHSICNLTKLETLNGFSFLDAGCGSGLFSLAAYRLGADCVVSIDIDPNSIACAHQLHLREGCPPKWQIVRASVLSMPFMVGEFNFVYSWGVLHHTGTMWSAIAHVSDLVSKQGLLYLAIYRENRYSHQWLQIKRFYNRQGPFLKRIMVFAYMVYSIIRISLQGQNPVKVIRNYGHNSRGMSWSRDIEDWLGGLPYEYTCPEKFNSIP